MKARRPVASGLLVLFLLAPLEALAADDLTLRLVVYQPGIVRLDGRDYLDLTKGSGRTPEPWRHFVMHYIPVEPGKHELTLKPDDAFAVPPFETVTAEGAAGDTVSVILGRPRILSSPPGAVVTVNGNPAGTTPVSINPADLGKSKVRLELTHYLPDSVSGDSILAVARASGTFRVEMKPADLTTTLLPESAMPRSYWDRNRTLGLAGSGILLTAGIYAGLRFKDQADEKYDAYRKTGNRERQKDLFHKAERFDRLSLLGWGIGECAFLATFFLIIHEEPRGLVPTARVDKSGDDGKARLQLGLSHDF